MPSIFISCVTAEFGAYRVRIAKDFRRANYEVKIQEDFKQVPEDTIQKLDAYIRECESVIHILGEGAGAQADPNAVAYFLKDQPQFLEAMKGVGDFRTLQLSYTQWEAYLAAYRGKKLYVYHATEPIRDGHPNQAFEFDKDWPVFEPTPEDAVRVRQHRELLDKLPVPRRYPSKFKDELSLIRQFLGDFSQELGSKVRASIKLHERFGLHRVDELKHLLCTIGKPLQEDGFLLVAFVQINGELPDADMPNSVAREQVRVHDYRLVDVLAENHSEYALPGFVKACLIRSKAKRWNRLAAALKSWLSTTIQEFNHSQATLLIDHPYATAGHLTEEGIERHWTEAFEYLDSARLPTPSFELAWRVAPADPQKRVFAEGYLRWGRLCSQVLKSDALLPATEVPTRFMTLVRKSGKYMTWLIDRLEVLVSEDELHHPWEYQVGTKPNDDDVLIFCPIVLRLLFRGQNIKPPPDPITRLGLACRLSECESFLADVRSRGGFFAMPLESEDSPQVIQRAAALASIGIWLRRTKPIDVAERCFDEFDGQSPVSVPRWVFEKKQDSLKDSPWRDVTVFYDHPEWPVFKFSNDVFSLDDDLRTLSGL